MAYRSKVTDRRISDTFTAALPTLVTSVGLFKGLGFFVAGFEREVGTEHLVRVVFVDLGDLSIEGIH